MAELTIITPTYNRADCLRECFQSLEAQSCHDFQWIVVDDGSTDNTKELVADFMESQPDFRIDYMHKENGGKHTALNASHPYICGKYVLILDSDDTLTADAVGAVLKAWHEWDDNKNVGQIIFLKGYTQDSPVCYVEHERVPVDTLKEPRISNSGRDCCDVFRAELFQKYPFPVFPGEKFIGEGAAFFYIEAESRGVYYNQVIYLCSYRQDGLTKAGRKLRIQNPAGGKYNSSVYMDDRLPLKTRLKKAVLYICYSKFKGETVGKAIRDTKYKALAMFAVLPGLLCYHFWRKKYIEEGRNDQ